MILASAGGNRVPVIAKLVQADEDTKLAAYLRKVHGRIVRIGREALRCLLARRGITFERTKTWKDPPDRPAKLDGIKHIIEHFP